MELKIAELQRMLDGFWVLERDLHADEIASLRRLYKAAQAIGADGTSEVMVDAAEVLAALDASFGEARQRSMRHKAQAQRRASVPTLMIGPPPPPAHHHRHPHHHPIAIDLCTAVWHEHLGQHKVHRLWCGPPSRRCGRRDLPEPGPSRPLISACSLIATPFTRHRSTRRGSHLPAREPLCVPLVSSDAQDAPLLLVIGAVSKMDVISPSLLSVEFGILAPYYKALGRKGTVGGTLKRVKRRKLICYKGGRLRLPADEHTLITLTIKGMRQMAALYKQSEHEALVADVAAVVAEVDDLSEHAAGRRGRAGSLEGIDVGYAGVAARHWVNHVRRRQHATKLEGQISEHYSSASSASSSASHTQPRPTARLQRSSTRPAALLSAAEVAAGAAPLSPAVRRAAQASAARGVGSRQEPGA